MYPLDAYGRRGKVNKVTSLGLDTVLGTTFVQFLLFESMSKRREVQVKINMNAIIVQIRGGAIF